jgi:hypothetical protein
MDPIDRIAKTLAWHCAGSLAVYLEIDSIIDSSVSVKAAFRCLESRGFMKFVDPDQLDTLSYDINRLQRCLDCMEDIKRLARKVFALNFFESDAMFVFNQEVSFSYACKMMSTIGPKLAHFSNLPTQAEVVRAELKLALNTPFSGMMSPESELLCLELMQHGDQANSAVTAI